jgi:hypothetical protein
MNRVFVLWSVLSVMDWGSASADSSMPRSSIGWREQCVDRLQKEVKKSAVTNPTFASVQIKKGEKYSVIMTFNVNSDFLSVLIPLGRRNIALQDHDWTIPQNRIKRMTYDRVKSGFRLAAIATAGIDSAILRSFHEAFNSAIEDCLAYLILEKKTDK